MLEVKDKQFSSFYNAEKMQMNENGLHNYVELLRRRKRRRVKSRGASRPKSNKPDSSSASNFRKPLAFNMHHLSGCQYQVSKIKFLNFITNSQKVYKVAENTSFLT